MNVTFADPFNADTYIVVSAWSLGVLAGIVLIPLAVVTIVVIAAFSQKSKRRD